MKCGNFAPWSSQRWSTYYIVWSSGVMTKLAYWAVNCSMRSMTAGVLSLGEPRGLKPRVPSGPLGWRTTVTWIRKWSEPRWELKKIHFNCIWNGSIPWALPWQPPPNSWSWALKWVAPGAWKCTTFEHSRPSVSLSAGLSPPQTPPHLQPKRRR